MRLRQRLIQPQRSLGSLFRFRHDLSRMHVETRELRVGFGESGVRQGVLRILRDRGIEILNRLPRSFLGRLGQVIAGQENLPDGLLASPAGAREASAFLRRQRDAHFAGDGPRHLAL